MADRYLNYLIDFLANSSVLRKDIRSIVTDLQSLEKYTLKLDTSSLQQANVAAKELGNILQNSINWDTGKLDLSSFTLLLQKSGQSLTYYQKQLQSLGPVGQEAFLKLAQTISSAEAPLARSNKLVTSLWTTLKNTARWQLTSSVIRTFVGSIETAYGYAKDLDASLNKIQIVTKNSADQMAEFAKQANNAAKALSTTTTEYTNASLIYYQQGLNKDQVQARTDTTIKLSNVAGISAEQASQQLTAVWNNFYNGTKTLEYYVDVMTKLGATTASSSSEIAEGMQKFAAVAGTVGLSYEYAASALATLTAKTRESADIVGTALRTLFSRIQSLNLGETLEDGTTLAKYSKALAVVGIDIKDANGNLKEMDTILDELGARWQSLAKDEQIALAETVAGVRQYTQLIALMNNWDYFKENLQTAYGSEGELDKQVAIYAKSWEAARDRVRAAAEDIWDSLINPDFYKDADNLLTPILTGIANLVDSLGGMKGVLATISLIMNQVFGERMAQGLMEIANSMGIVQSQEQQLSEALRKQALDATIAIESSRGNLDDPQFESYIERYKEEVALRSKAFEYSKDLTEEQKKELSASLEIIRNLSRQTEELLRQKQTIKEMIEGYEEQAIKNVTNEKKQDSRTTSAVQGALRDVGLEEQAKNVRDATQLVDTYRSALEKLNTTQEQYQFMSDKRNKNGTFKDIDELQARIAAVADLGTKDTRALNEVYRELGVKVREGTKEVDGLRAAIETLASRDTIDRIQQLWQVQGKDGSALFENLKNSMSMAMTAAPEGGTSRYDALIQDLQTAYDKRAEAELKLSQLAEGDSGLDQARENLARYDEEIAQIVEILTNSKNKNLVKAVQEYLSEQSGARAELEQLISAIGTDPRFSLVSALKAMEDVTPDFINGLVDIVKNSQNASEAVNGLFKELERLSQSQAFRRGVLNEFTGIVGKSGQITDANRGDIEKMLRDNNVTINGKSADKASNEEIIEHFNKEKEVLDELVLQLNKYKETLAQALGMPIADIDKVASGFVNIQNTSNGAEASIKATKKSIDALTASMEAGQINNWAQTIVLVGRELSAVSMAMNSIMSLGDVFSGQVTGGQALVRVLTAISTATMAFNTIMTASKKLTESINAARKAGIAIQEAQIVLNEVNSTQEAKEIAQEALLNAQRDKKNLGIITTIGLKVIETLVTWGLVDAEVAAAAAGGIFTAVLIAAVAVIFLAVKGIQALADWMRRDEIQAQRLAEAEQELADSNKEVAESAEELASAFDAYKDAKFALDDCVRGTEEFDEALQKTNDTAKALLEKLVSLGLKSSEIKDLYTRDNETGAISINEPGVKNIQTKIDSQRQAAEMASSISGIFTTNQQVSNALSSGALYQLFGMNDFVFEKDVLGDDGFYYKQHIDREELAKDIKDSFEAIADATDDEFKEILEGFGLNLNSLSDNDIANVREQLTTLAEKSLAASETLKLIADLKVDSILGDQYGGAEKRLASDKLQERTKELEDEWLDYLTGSGINKASGYTNEKYQATLKALQDAGYQFEAQKDNAVRGTDGSRSLAFLENGQEVVHTAEWIAEVLASAQALEELGNNAEEASKVLKNLDTNLTAEAASGVRNWISSGNFENTSVHDMEDMINAANASISDPWTKTSAEIYSKYLQDAFGKTDEELKLILGEDYGQQFANAIKEYNEGLLHFTDGLISNVKDAWNELDGDIKELSPKALKIISGALTDAFVYAGQDGLDMAKSVIDSLDVNNIEGFTDVLASMDWSTDEPKDFVAALDEAQVLTGLTTEQLLDFAAAMKDANAIKTFDQLAESYKSIHDIVDELKQGDTISAEDFATLGDAYQGYFTRMLDGTYKLTSDADKFYELVRLQTIGEYQANMANISEQMAKLEGIKGYDLNELLNYQGFVDEAGDNKYRGDKVRLQLNVLDAMGYNPEQIAAWRNDLSDNWVDDMQVIQDIANAVSGYKAQLENLDGEIDKCNNSLYEQQLAIAESYDSFEDLNDAYKRGGKFGVQAYNQALIDLDKLLDTVDLDADKWRDFSVYIQKAAKSSDKFDDSLADNSDAAKIVAKSIMKMNDGVQALADNYEDWTDIIEKSSMESEEYADAMNGLRNALSDVLDVSSDFISNDFVAEHLDLIKQAATGSAEAIDALKAALATDIFNNIIDINRLEQLRDAVFGIFSELQNLADSLDLKVGASIDIENLSEDEQAFIDKCNELIRAANMTADLANALFDAIGFETTFVTQPQVTQQRVPIYVTETQDAGTRTDEDGNTWLKTRTVTYQDGYYEAEGEIDAIAMATSTDGTTEVPQIQSITKKPTGSYNNWSSDNAGGPPLNKSSGGSKKHKTHTDAEGKKDSEKERYHEINRALEENERQLNRIESAKDRAFGINKLKLFDKEIEEITAKQSNLVKKLKEAEGYLGIDTTALREAFSGLDIEEFIGEHGIINFDGLQDLYFKEYNDFIDYYNAQKKPLDLKEEDLTEEEQALLDKLEEEKKKHEDLFKERQRAISQYEETLDLIEELKDNLVDMARQQWDKEFGKITYKMEVILEVKNMKDAARNLSKAIAESFGDALTHTLDFKGRKGTATLGWEQAMANKDLFAQQQAYYKTLMDFKALGNDVVDVTKVTSDPEQQAMLKQLLDENGVIDMEAWKNEFENLQQAIIDNAQALLDWIEEVENMIPNAVDAARERLDVFLNQLEHNTTILNTIKELYALQGVTYKTQQGFEKLQNVAKEKIDAAIANAKINKQWYEGMKAKVELAYRDLANYQEGDEQYDFYYKRLQAYLKEMNQAEEEWLSKSQEAYQAAQDKYLQAVEKTAYDFGQAVSNGLGLDLLQDKYDHYIEKEERYFDKVNEAYHVSSWYNKLQQDIDNTKNSLYKDRLKALQEEIDLRRENNTLSQYDLDILEAKYKVLLAQMALEDALNNKTNLRLVRDRQGNWNYQYTADADDIAEKEKALIDAENEWYNIAKEQVKDVTGLIIETWQECQEKIKEIYSDMTLTDDERSARAQEIYAYYCDKVKYLENEKLIAIADMTEAGNESLLDMAVLYGDEVSDLTGLTSENIKNIIEENGTSIIGLLTTDSETIKEIVGNNTQLIDLFDNVYAQDLANMTTNTENFENMFNGAIDKMEDNLREYGDTVGEIAETTGTDVETLGEKVEETSEKTDELAEAGLRAVDSMLEQIAAIDELAISYSNLTREIYETIAAMEQLAHQQATDISVESGITFDKDIDYSALMSKYLKEQGGTVGDDTYNQLLAQRNAKIDWLETLGKDATYWGTRGSATTDLFNNLTSGSGDQDWYQRAAAMYTQEQFDKWMKEHIPGFATGGYTGEFDNAKLAFLHEKELVLNQKDTENLLAAVSTMRALGQDFWDGIIKSLDSNAIVSLGLMAQFIHTNDNSVGVGTQPLEQKISIEKIEFPNATDKEEILDALHSLPDRAAQWARTRKE